MALAQDWADVRLRPMRYDWIRIRAQAEAHQRLEPAARARPQAQET